MLYYGVNDLRQFFETIWLSSANSVNPDAAKQDQNMKFSEQWLRSLVNRSLDSEQLAHLLTMAGLEVEEMESTAPAFSAVVVCRSAVGDAP